MMPNTTKLALLGAVLFGLVLGGCSDSDPLPSGNVVVSQQVGATGSSNATCMFVSFKPTTQDSAGLLRAADGTCASDTPNAGLPCGRSSECGPAGLCLANRCSSTSANAGAGCNTSANCPGGECLPLGCNTQSTNAGAECASNLECLPSPECSGALFSDSLGGSPINIIPIEVNNVQLLSPACGFCGGNAAAPCVSATDCPANVCQTGAGSPPFSCALSPDSCLTDDDCPPASCDAIPTPQLPQFVLTRGRFAVSRLAITGRYINFDTGLSRNCSAAANVIPAYDVPQTVVFGPDRANVVGYVFDVAQMQSVFETGPNACGSPGDGTNTFFGQIENILDIVGN